MKSFKTFLIEQKNLEEWGVPSIKRFGKNLLGIMAAGAVSFGSGVGIGKLTQNLRNPSSVTPTTEPSSMETPTTLLPSKSIPKTPDGKILRQEPVKPQNISTETQQNTTTKPKMSPRERHEHVLNLASSMLQHTEGFEENAYQDITGKWTKGYGTIDGVEQGQTIDKETARKAKLDHLTKMMEHLKQHHPFLFDLSSEENNYPPGLIASFLDLGYNNGAGVMTNMPTREQPQRGTSITIPLRNKDILGAIKGMRDFNQVTINGIKRPIAGQTNRRHLNTYWALKSLHEDGHITTEEYNEHLNDSRQWVHDTYKKNGWRDSSKQNSYVDREHEFDKIMENNSNRNTR